MRTSQRQCGRQSRIQPRISRAELAQLMEQYRAPLIGYIRRMVRDPFVAEDLCHEALIKLMRNAHRYDARLNLHNWIYTIARNVTLDYLRSRQRAREVFVADVEAAYSNDPIENVADQESVTALQDALAQLPQRERDALLRKEGCDETFREIGADFGCTISHVRTLISHAKARLQEIYPAEVIASRAG